jgi:hypothetical protein
VRFLESGGAILSDGRLALLNEEGELWPASPGAGLDTALGFREVELDSRFSGEVALDDAVLELRTEYLQRLELTRAEPVASTTAGAPFVVRADVSGGLAVHAACLLGAMIFREKSGAQALFDRTIRLCEPYLDQTARVTAKPDGIDVSILVDPQGRPALAGITNYSRRAERVEIRGVGHLSRVDATGSCDRRVDGDLSFVTVGARSAAAIYR